MALLRAGPAGLIEEQAHLGIVGRDDRGLADEPAHLADHLLRHGGEKGAVVAEHRIHHGKAVLGQQLLHGPRHVVHLRRTGHEARVDALELLAEPLPVVQLGAHVGREVAQGEAFRADGLRGEHGGRQGHGLDAHAGEDGDDGGEGGTSEAGDVVDDAGPGDGVAHGVSPCGEEGKAAWHGPGARPATPWGACLGSLPEAAGEGPLWAQASGKARRMPSSGATLAKPGASSRPATSPFQTRQCPASLGYPLPFLATASPS